PRTPRLTTVSSQRARYSFSVIFAPATSGPKSRSRSFLVRYACASRMGPRIVRLFAFLGFVVAAEIDPDEPPTVASCDDLANFASHRNLLLWPAKEGTLHAHCWRQGGYWSVDRRKAGLSAASGGPTMAIPKVGAVRHTSGTQSIPFGEEPSSS